MGFHWYELLPLVLLGVLFFGPKRLPEMGAAVGKTIREFQNSMRHIEEPEPTGAQPATATLPGADAATPATPLADAAVSQREQAASEASSVEAPSVTMSEAIAE
ncbi:MAG: twin-arginine translocase TatA/TatE family subunit [Ktedonobacterales bacterium]